MAVSLFRRWRSQKFQDLVGQESVVSTLQNVLQGGSPARAYLFCGPRGTGKTSSARIFAKAINCEQGPAAEPCGSCHQCVSIADGSNLDVFEIDAASHTQVDKIRDFIVEKVHFTPVAARFKVYIIDEVHKLSTSSFNALLKTLEEPPAHVLFILATTHPHELPATILSRCQRYDFKPLTASQTERHLAMIAEAEKLQVDADAARQLARAADGSLRDALVLFEQAVVFSDGRVTREKVLELLGGVGYEVLEEMFLDLIEGRSAGALRRLDEWIGRGRDLKRLAESFQEHLRMMLLLKVKSEDQSIRHLSGEERASLEKLCAAMTTAAITSWLRQVMELLASIRHGHAARLEWELLLVACAQPEVDANLQGLERRLERLEASRPPAETAESAPTGSALEGLVARLEALEARPESGSTPVASAGQSSAPDAQWVQRLETLEAQLQAAPEPRLWDKLCELEAALSALQATAVETAAAPVASAPLELLREGASPSPVSEHPPTPPQAPVASRPLAEPRAGSAGPESAVATPAPTSGALVRDAVDDWLEMPQLLVNPDDFRRELPLFSSYAPTPDPEPATPEPDNVVHEPDPPEPPAARSEPTPRPSEPVAPVVSTTQVVRQVEVVTTTEVTVSAGAAPAEAVDLKDFWRSLMLAIKEKDKRLHAVLTDARLTSLEASRFEIALPVGFEWHRDKLQEGRALLEAVVSELAGGRRLDMECTLGGEKAAPPKETEHDDLVARANGVFGGASIVE